MPYAQALVGGETELNRCPPGGRETIATLAQLLGRAVKPLDETCGEHTPRMLAVIDDAWCIGCTLCIKACPVDAILGAAKRMHTVLQSECTGCELCVAPCPVDCIELIPDPNPPYGVSEWLSTRAGLARERFMAREQRLVSRHKPGGLQSVERGSARERRKQEISRAVERARARRNNAASEAARAEQEDR